MIATTLDYWIAVGVVALMPLIIWVNGYNRQSGLMGYLWRESPNLARVGLVFLGFVWLSALEELLTYYGVLTPGMHDVLSIVLGIPLLILSLAVLVMATMAFVKYRRTRSG
jgi:hypothetical protein